MQTEHCVALLEDSASVLLHCLEMVDPAAVVGKCYLTWEVPEAVKCASFLRRIYEEMRQQKDAFGRHWTLFLCNYIWTYSGCPLKTGIRRKKLMYTVELYRWAILLVAVKPVSWSHFWGY